MRCINRIRHIQAQPGAGQSNLDFTLTVHAPLPGEKGGSFRTRFFYFDAFDRKTKQKVSTIRLADLCSNGIVRCGLNTNEGQFHSNDEMKELKGGIDFEPIALARDFSKTRYSGPDAPYAFVFPDTEMEFYYFNRPFD
jgi:hypothetical protein